MGSEAECEIPKLSLYSFPGKAKEASGSGSGSGMLTPPLHASASVPFQWEEAPGKPRPCPPITTTSNAQSLIKPKAARCLELPPRLLAEAKVNNIPSPTTVLDGPDHVHAARFVSKNYNTKGGSFRSLQENKRVKVKFGSSRWGSFRKAPGRVVQGSFDFSAPMVADDGAHDDEVKNATLRRKGSLSSLGHMSWQAFMKAISKWSHGDVCRTN